jgi:other hect domain ubiquitin protein ligase E3
MNRMRLLSKTSSKTLDFMTETNFGIGFEQLSSLDPSLMRPVKPSGADPFVAFELELLNQFVEGAAGPYRQYFSDVSTELMDSACPLFEQCANGRSPKLTLSCKECFVPRFNNFTLTNPIFASMYRFLGMLFGICMRTGVKMTLDWPALLWKQLVNDPVTRADLRMIDTEFVDLCDALLRAKSQKEFDTLLGRDSMSGAASLMPTVDEVDDIAVPLASGDGGDAFELSEEAMKTAIANAAIIERDPLLSGLLEVLNYDNRVELIERCVEIRMREFSTVTNAIRAGIARIVPAECVDLMNWRELEIAIAGRKTIDLALLRRHTTYSGFSDVATQERVVEWFWQTLEDFGDADRVRFIQFSWAQTRIPNTDADFVQQRVRMNVKAGKKTDMSLPKADTCFFNLEMPIYSSKDLLREKLFKAITESVSMNADEPLRDDIPAHRGFEDY